MSKRIFLFTLILVYAMSVNSFAAGNQEKNDRKKGEQKEIFEPALSGTDIIVDAGSANILHEYKHTHAGNDETGLEQCEDEKGNEYSKEA